MCRNTNYYAKVAHPESISSMKELGAAIKTLYYPVSVLIIAPKWHENIRLHNETLNLLDSP